MPEGTVDVVGCLIFKEVAFIAPLKVPLLAFTAPVKLPLVAVIAPEMVAPVAVRAPALVTSNSSLSPIAKEPPVIVPISALIRDRFPTERLSAESVPVTVASSFMVRFSAVISPLTVSSVPSKESLSCILKLPELSK